jgi:hypothetical protein
MNTRLHRAVALALSVMCSATIAAGVAAAATTIGTNINTGGTLTTTGHAVIGTGGLNSYSFDATSASFPSPADLSISRIINDLGDVVPGGPYSGLDVSLVLNDSTDGATAEINGVTSQVCVASGSGALNNVYGLYSYLENDTTNGKTVTNAYGVYGELYLMAELSPICTVHI